MICHIMLQRYSNVKGMLNSDGLINIFLSMKLEKDNPNGIHGFDPFEEEGHAERKYNHFRLIDLTREEMYAMGVPAILDDEEE